MKFKGSRLDKNLLFFKIGIRMFLNGDKFYQRQFTRFEKRWFIEIINLKVIQFLNISRFRKKRSKISKEYWYIERGDPLIWITREERILREFLEGWNGGKRRKKNDSGCRKVSTHGSPLSRDPGVSGGSIPPLRVPSSLWPSSILYRQFLPENWVVPGRRENERAGLVIQKAGWQIHRDSSSRLTPFCHFQQNRFILIVRLK